MEKKAKGKQNGFIDRNDPIKSFNRNVTLFQENFKRQLPEPPTKGENDESLYMAKHPKH